MLGTSEVPGLCVLTITDIFDAIRKDDDNEYDVKITYVEIYTESTNANLTSSRSHAVFQIMVNS